MIRSSVTYCGYEIWFNGRSVMSTTQEDLDVLCWWAMTQYAGVAASSESWPNWRAIGPATAAWDIMPPQIEGSRVTAMYVYRKFTCQPLHYGPNPRVRPEDPVGSRGYSWVFCPSNAPMTAVHLGDISLVAACAEIDRRFPHTVPPGAERAGARGTT